MGGRGRGRGRGGSGALPPSMANRPMYERGNAGNAGAPGAPLVSRTEPLPDYPTVSLPTPEDPTEELDLKTVQYADRLTNFMRSSPFYLMEASQKQKLDRYSDKYLAHLKDQDRKGRILAINTDLAFFPDELHAIYDPEKAKKWAAAAAAQSSKAGGYSFGDAMAKLKALEEADGNAAAEEGDEDDEGDEIVYDEDEFEDETDYNLSYFDNGEDVGGDYDDGDEGPVY